MKKTVETWLFTGIIALGTSWCATGVETGNLLVYALDSSTAGAPPPQATAVLDGTNFLSFGSNPYVVFENTPVGTHTVMVVSAENGYLPRESSSTPNAVNDPESDYGNPKQITIAKNETTPWTFRFDPSIRLSAVVRDAWTMERLAGATIECSVNAGPNTGLAYTRFPWQASYQPCWQSEADGRFPTNTFLYLDDYDMEVARAGYQTLTSTNVVTNASVGDALDLEEIFLTPIDNNNNLIGDAWETAYFGTGGTVVAEADTDGDGISNRDEYLAGTDPTNKLCALTIAHAISNDTMTLTWNTKAGRTYRVAGTTNLVADTWVQVAGSWEAAPNQTEMSWVETNMHLSRCNTYCVEVVPCTWLGTNHVLVNTNWPSSGGGTGGGGSTNGPPVP